MNKLICFLLALILVAYPVVILLVLHNIYHQYGLTYSLNCLLAIISLFLLVSLTLYLYEWLGKK